MSILSEILPKKEIITYFIVLGLEEKHIRAAVAEISGKEVKILGTGKADFSDPEKEVEAVDEAISIAEKSLPEKLLISNVIFALPQFYLEGDNVKPEYLTRLKKIAKELDLKAYGFVDYVSSTVNYLENEEGSPPTILLMDLSEGHITVSLVRLGKVVQHEIVNRSDSVVADFSSILPNLKAEILPSKIIIFDFSHKTDEIREELLKFPWHKHSIFLHTPKIEILGNQKIMTAIVKAAATNFLPNVSDPQPGSAEKEASREVNDGKKISSYDPEAIGKAEVKQETFKERFGFVHESLSEKVANIKKETRNEVRISSERKRGIEKILSFLKIGLPRIDFGHKGVIIAFGGLLTALFLIYFVRNYPTANISLITYPLLKETPKEIMFAKETGQPAGSLPVIPVKNMTTEVSGMKSTKSTGTTLLGDKARGEVTIYNKTTKQTSLTKGTVINSGIIKFSIDDEIKIASASETGEGITFGKATVKVTAAAIGSESNLGANSNFTLSEFNESNLSAKNNLPLSGGTSREITTVSEEDQNTLEEDLTAQLIKEAKQKILTEIKINDKLLDSPVSTSVSSKKFSQEVGSEAKELSLELTLKIEGYVYNKDELEKLIDPTSLNIAEGYKFDPTKTLIKLKQAEGDKNGNIRAQMVILAYFIPDLNLEEIKKEIKGKSFTKALEYLEKIDKVGGVKISPENKLPFLSKTLPFNSDNIRISIISR